MAIRWEPADAAEIERRKATPVRARTPRGTYKGDDPETPDNEAWEKPKPKRRKAKAKD